MTEAEANKCMLGMILFDRYDWSDAQLAAWNRAICRYTDVDVARRASEQLIEEVEPRDWSLPRWREAYRRISEREQGRRREATRACTNCDGTGWVDAPDFHAPYCRDPLTCHCHAVDPCSCSDGDPGPAGRPQLEAPTMSLVEYLELLTERATAGNQVAVKELAIWTKNRKSPYVRALEVQA